MLLYWCVLVQICLSRKENCYTFFATWTEMKTRRKTTKTFTSLPYLLAPSHLFNRARLGGPGASPYLSRPPGEGPRSGPLFPIFDI